MLRRDEGERTEFLTFSLWDSRDAIRAFAGDDIETAVYYPEDERYLVKRDDPVRHYDVVDTVGGLGLLAVRGRVRGLPVAPAELGDDLVSLPREPGAVG